MEDIMAKLSLAMPDSSSALPLQPLVELLRVLQIKLRVALVRADEIAWEGQRLFFIDAKRLCAAFEVFREP